jgi:V/A-type H+/Na+-transporting ATPase subunit I
VVLRPVRMARIALLGLRSDEERLLTVLHDLRIAQVEALSPETMAQLGPERGPETLRRVGDEALRFRGLVAALPPEGRPEPRRFDTVAEILAAAETVPIDREVGELVREADRLETEAKATEETLAALADLAFFPDRLEVLRSPSFVALQGRGSRAAADAVRASLQSDGELLLGPGAETIPFVAVARTSRADAVLAAAQAAGVRLAPVPSLAGTVAEESVRLRARRAEIEGRRAELRERLASIARAWYPTVAAIQEALEIQNRTSELLTKLGASRDVFALEAWVPARDVPALRGAVERATGGRVQLLDVPTAEEPPTMMSNPAGIRRFEFFVKFYSLPQASEWDPTLVFAIVFPIFFGFMLGDWGYGLVILLVSLWMIAGFPGARHLPAFGRRFVRQIMGPKAMQQLAWTLLPGCGLAIALGLAWDEFFGYGLLHHLIGYNPPIKPDADVGLLLLVAGFIGLAMVTLGFLFGALQEYFRRHRRGVLAKSGGILFAWGVAFFGLAVIHHATGLSAHPIVAVWYACLAGGLVLIVGGEGANGLLVGLIEIVSHILSYTRLVGILLASVILALVINTVAGGLVRGGAVGIVAGILLLVVGQTFNVILGVFEPGIQGARLLFVEYFSKFYRGNGRPFRPFGGARTHTVSTMSPPAPPGGPIVRAPEP